MEKCLSPYVDDLLAPERNFRETAERPEVPVPGYHLTRATEIETNGERMTFFKLRLSRVTRIVHS